LFLFAWFLHEFGNCNQIPRTKELLQYTDDVNLLGDNINTMKENIEVLIDASKEVGLELKIGNTAYTLISLECRAKS
jgi:hypothetical protein